MQQPTNDGVGKGEGSKGLASCVQRQSRGAVVHKATNNQPMTERGMRKAAREKGLVCGSNAEEQWCVTH
jgi:hypothetical protein